MSFLRMEKDLSPSLEHSDILHPTLKASGDRAECWNMLIG